MERFGEGPLFHELLSATDIDAARQGVEGGAYVAAIERVDPLVTLGVVCGASDARSSHLLEEIEIYRTLGVVDVVYRRFGSTGPPGRIHQTARLGEGGIVDVGVHAEEVTVDTLHIFERCDIIAGCHRILHTIARHQPAVSRYDGHLGMSSHIVYIV